MSAPLLVAQLLAAPANAQALSWQFVAGAVLSPNPGDPFVANSIGSPTVVYDSLRGRLLMQFETVTSATDPNCPAGIYGIGGATSTDGISWTYFPGVSLSPTPGSGTYWQCVTAHPTNLFNSTTGNGRLLTWFKAQQGTVACPGPAWGCTDVTGIGHMRSIFDAAGNVTTRTVSASPVWASSNAAFPKMTRDGNLFRLVLQVYPDVWMGTSTVPNSFSPSPTLTLAEMQAAVAYAQNELFNPSLICDDDPAFPDAMFVGARDTNAAGVVEGGWSKAMLDPIGGSWILDTTPQQTWLGNDEWRHFDVHKLNTGTDEYVVWFDEKDAAGNNFIRFGGTDISITGADLVSKACP